MKKLMVLFAAGALASAANAMAINWTFYDDNGDFGGEQVYMLLGDSVKTDWADADAIAKASVGNGTVEYAAAASLSKDDAIVKEDFSGYFVIVTDDGFYTSGPTDFTADYVYDPDNRESSPGTFEWGTNDSLSEKYEYKGVPEPTSGLLLLLGVAGLALRRRRA